ncbi:hypothetical protein BJ741DRAFT_705715 [Chytriomyces cf. hyalinus JEL632]|nr:hypothetical protein BJ741DRAFT_705715 [Chytriomyces cf. hyalinus JEL632]
MDNRPTITSLPPEVLSVIIDFLSPRHRSDPWVHTDRVCKQWRLLSLAHGNTLDPSPLVFRARRAFSDIQQAFAQAFVLLAQDPLRVAALRKLAVKDWMWPHLSRMPHLLLNLHHLNVLSMEPHGIVSPRVAHLAEALQQNTTQLRLICFPDVCSFLLFASSFDSSEHLAGIAQKIEIEMPTVRDRKKDTSIEPAMAPYPCDLSFLAVAKALGGPFTTLHKLRLVTESDYISPMTCQESGQHGFFPNVESLSERNRASSLLPYMEKLISYRSVGIACPSIEAFTFNPSVSSTLTTIAMDVQPSDVALAVNTEVPVMRNGTGTSLTGFTTRWQ